MNLDALSIMNLLTQTIKEKKVMNIPDWLVGMQLVSVLCGGIFFVVTVVGGYYLVKGLESLKGEIENESDKD